MDGWNTSFLLGWLICRGYVSFREGRSQWRNLFFVKGQWAGMIAHQVHRWDTNSIRQTLYQTRTDCRRLREDLSSPLEVSLSLCSIHHLGPGTHDMEWFWANSCIFQHVFLAHPTGCATGCEDFPDSSQDNRRGGGTGEKTLSEWLLAEQPARVKPNFLLLSDCQPQRGFARGHGKHYALWRHTETHSQRWNSQHSIISPENHAI